MVEIESTRYMLCYMSQENVFLSSNNQLLDILVVTLLTKSLYQLHYLQIYSTTLPQDGKEHKALSTLW